MRFQGCGWSSRMIPTPLDQRAQLHPRAPFPLFPLLQRSTGLKLSLSSPNPKSQAFYGLWSRIPSTAPAVAQMGSRNNRRVARIAPRWHNLGLAHPGLAHPPAQGQGISWERPLQSLSQLRFSGKGIPKSPKTPLWLLPAQI